MTVLPPLRRAGIVTCVTSLTALLAAAPVLAEPTLTITLDTPPSHVRNIYVGHFAEALTERSGGALTVEIFDSGQLYSSRDAARAVARGDAGMAIVSTGSLSQVEPALNVLEFPMFSGLPVPQISEIVDGPLGQRLTDMLAERMGVVALPGWYVLGAINTYSTTRPLNSLQDLNGLQVRHPGGQGAIAYLEELGATPVSMPFTDVPMALQQGTVDAIVSSNASILSGSLHESGLGYAYLSNMLTGFYIPIVSQSYWDQLTEDQQTLFRATWAEFVPGQRDAALRQQDEARVALEAAGMVFVDQPPEEAAAMRERLSGAQERMIAELGLDEEFMTLARDAVQ